MKTGYVWIVSLLLVGRVLAQTPAYEQLKPSIAGLPDTTRITKLCDFALAAARKTRFADAQLALDDALSIAQKTGEGQSLRKVYRLVGYLRHAEGQYPEAIAAYQRALPLSTSAQRYGVWINIGIMHMKSLDYDRAEAYFRRVLDATTPVATEDDIASANLNMGALADQRHQANDAVLYFQRASTVYKKHKDWNQYYMAVLNSAVSYNDLKQYTKSVALFKKCLRYADALEKQGDAGLNTAHNTRTHVYANIPYPLVHLNRFDEAEHYANMALAYARHDPNRTTHLMWIYDALTVLYETKGDYKKALVAHKQWAVYRDSTQNTVRSQKLAELETRYQTKEKEAQIKQLDETNGQQHRQIWAGVSGLVVLSLLLGTMVWQYRRIQRSRTKIQQQSNQLSLMMKELHHRVKNNLAIVSSLLKLQSNRLEDENALRAVRTGQQRVEAMSLIHQRLYQTDRVTTVNIREYLTDLAESLMQAYDYSPDDFDLIIDVEQQELDVDVAMPLGLIANELITNAFKYAYTSGQRPLLRIGLQDQNGLTLDVQDNGPGIDQTDWQQRGSRASFGKRLISSLSEQLDGTVELLPQSGACFRLHIPKTRLRAA